MAGELQRIFPFGRWPTIPDWFEDLDFRMPSMPGTEHMIRIEESQEGDVYQVCAELPGMDPEKDIDVTVADGLLTIHAERSEEKKEKHRSEFRYGSFTRSIRLPAGAREEDVNASYDKGLLTVRAPMGEVAKPSRKVEISKS